MNPSPYIVPPSISGSAIAFTGNPYSTYSTGTYVSNYQPVFANTLGLNLDTNSLLVNSDTFEVDFNVSSGNAVSSPTGNNFNAVFRMAIPAGPLTIRNGAYFGDGQYFPLGSSPIIVGSDENNLTALAPSGVNAYFQPLGIANITSPTINVNNIWLYREYAVGGDLANPWFNMNAVGENVATMSAVVGTGTITYSDIQYQVQQNYSFSGGLYTAAPFNAGRHDILINRNSEFFQCFRIS